MSTANLSQLLTTFGPAIGNLAKTLGPKLGALSKTLGPKASQLIQLAKQNPQLTQQILNSALKASGKQGSISPETLSLLLNLIPAGPTAMDTGTAAGAAAGASEDSGLGSGQDTLSQILNLIGKMNAGGQSQQGNSSGQDTITQLLNMLNKMAAQGTQGGQGTQGAQGRTQGAQGTPQPQKTQTRTQTLNLNQDCEKCQNVKNKRKSGASLSADDLSLEAQACYACEKFCMLVDENSDLSNYNLCQLIKMIDPSMKQKSKRSK